MALSPVFGSGNAPHSYIPTGATTWKVTIYLEPYGLSKPLKIDVR